MAVARHPPHRSVRAELPHTAPASGQTQWRLSGYGSNFIRRSRRSVEKSDSAPCGVPSTVLYHSLLQAPVLQPLVSMTHAQRCLWPLCAGCGRSKMDSPRPEGLLSTNSAGGWPLNRLSTFVRSLHRYYAPVRLPRRVHVEIAATGLPRPDRPWDTIGHPWDLPVSVQRVCMHAMGL